MTKRKPTTRVFSAFLALALVASLTPSFGTAYAADTVGLGGASDTVAAPLASDAASEPAALAAAPASVNGTASADDAQAAGAEAGSPSSLEDSGTVDPANRSSAFAPGAVNAVASEESASVKDLSVGALVPLAVPQEESGSRDSSVQQIWVDGTNGDDANDGISRATAFKTFAAARAAIASTPSIITVNALGTFATLPAFTVPTGVTLKIADDTIMTGAGGAGITLAAGSFLACESGKSLTMSGFGTALTVQPGAELHDGAYVLDGNAIGFSLKGSIKGSSRDALTVSAQNSSGKGFDYTSDARFEGCAIDVVANGENSEQYAGLYMTNASLTTKGVWYYFDPDSGKGGIHLDHADFYAYKAKGSYHYGQVCAILGNSVLTNGSTLTGDGSRITLSAKLTVVDSKVVIKNSTAGGLNINYTPAEAVFTNSTLETTNMRYTPSYGTGQTNGPCYLTFQGNSVVNTDAANKTADNGGANRSTGSTYVVTGGSFLVAYDPSYNYNVTTPTNGPANGDEYLSLFTLADPSFSSLNPVNKLGSSYEYPVANASRDGQKHVWTPAAKVVFRLNNNNAAFPDGTSANKTASTIRGYNLDFVTGNAEPGTPVDASGIDFLGWFYKDDTGVEHEFNWADNRLFDLEVYAKWDAKTVVYHNGVGVDYIVSADSDAASAEALDYEVIAQNLASFALAGKGFTHWTIDEAGHGEPVNPGDTVAFGSAKTIDLYAQYQDREYAVAFSANGGTFAADSVFKTNTDDFYVVSDLTGGELAVLKKKALYGQDLHSLLGGTSHNDLSPEKANPSKLGSLLDDKYRWYTTPDYADRLNFVDQSIWGFSYPGKNPVITADTTYYIKWADDPAVEQIKAAGNLDGDLWGYAGTGSQKDSTRALKVSADGTDTFSLTGAVGVAGIKAQMEAIESRFSQDAGNLAGIKLAGVSSTFKTTLTLPEGVKVPRVPQVQAENLGDLFYVSGVETQGRDIIVTFGLKGVFTNYRDLKAAVNTTGSAGRRSSLPSTSPLAAPGFDMNVINDVITLTVSGLSLDSSSDKVVNGAELTATGAVEGSFTAFAQGTGGVSKKFDFTWTASQVAAGKDVRAQDAAAIQQTILVKKPYELTLGADMLAFVLPADPAPADLVRAGTDTEHSSVMGVHQGSRVNITGTVDTAPVKSQMAEIENQFGAGVDVTLSDDVSSTFTAAFTVPEGLELPAALDADTVVTEGFDRTFTVSDVSVSGRTVTVTMSLNKDAIRNADSNEYTYLLLKDAVEKVGDTMKVTIPGIKVGEGVADGARLTTMGAIEGAFAATASSPAGIEKDFSFKWTGEQTPDGKDAIAAADNNAIQLTFETPSPIDVELPADLLSGIETEHAAVYETFAGAELALTGALRVDSIKAQMEAIETRFNNPDGSAIGVDIKDFGFTAAFTVPAGITLPASLDLAALSIEQFGGGFKVASATVAGDTVTVAFELSDPASIRTYADLKAVVGAAGGGDGGDGWMRVTVPGAKLADDLAEGTQLTVTAAVRGTFKAVATSSQAGRAEAFSFRWTGSQWPDGKDAAAAVSDDAVRFTAQVVPTVDAELPGDMLIGTDTEHAAVILVKKADVLTYTGALDVNAVRQQMAAIEALYPGMAHDDIAVDVKECSFTASFTVPAEMSLPATLAKDDIVVHDFGGFKVTGVRASGRTVTVEMELGDSIATYQQLKAAVDSAGNADGWMKLDIPGITITGGVSEGQQLTVVGAVAGTFKAVASSQAGARKAFSFKWNAVQWPDGKDVVAQDGNDTIQLTVEIAPQEQPPTPGPQPQPQPQPQPEPGPEPEPGPQPELQPGPQPGPGPEPTPVPGSVRVVTPAPAGTAATATSMPTTGDALLPLAVGVGVLAIVGGSLLVLSVRRMRKR